MRIRSIKPEFWTDKRVASWDVFTRLFFIGLWSAADDHGRGSAEPARLAAELFPYDLSRDPSETLANVSRALATLSECGRIVIYCVGDECFFEVANWTRHQRVDKPGKSRIPTRNADVVQDTRETLARSSRLEQGAGSVETEQVSCADGALCAERQGVLIDCGESLPRTRVVKRRPRDPLFDALAAVGGAKPERLTRSAACSCAVKLAEIRDASPDVTPEEIDIRAGRYRRKFRGAACTPAAIAKHWAELAEDPSPVDLPRTIKGVF